ncbi:adhesion G-protein coupled receptor D1-like [Porites lutea]|uniref:adhesion G-protein coupled receptor D1-like n=1 Tax=Porites lutea TaxID=51062 RepID=UPI003CC5E49A
MKMVQSNSEDLVVSGSSRSHSDRLQESDVHIRLPASMFHEKGGYMAAIVYSNLHELLPSEAQTFLDGIPTESGYIGSRIFAIAVEPLKYSLQGRALFDFGHLKPTLRSSKPECVFWNFSMTGGGSNGSSGSWSRRGCKTENYTSRRTYCSCDHLTHFAVLMQLKDHEIPVKHRMALELITYIGCAFSLMGEFITIVAYVVFLNLKAGDTQIRLNFVISIAVAQLIFILGIDATQTKAICTTIAAAIHYFFLVSFCWMLIEGLTLYSKVVKVFDTDFKMWPFCAFSWGFPLALVSISLLTAAATEGGITSYVADSFCWLSFSNGFVWFFVAPVLIISILNVFVLARVTRELFTMHPTNVSSESNKFKRVLRACVVLFPLLGVTWVFGVLSVTDLTGMVFQYLFTICNSLQGFLIFLLHVVRSSEFRVTVKRKLRRWGSKRNTTVVPAIILPTNNNKNDSYDMRSYSIACVRKGGGASIDNS